MLSQVFLDFAVIVFTLLHTISLLPCAEAILYGSFPVSDHRADPAPMAKTHVVCVSGNSLCPLPLSVGTRRRHYGGLVLLYCNMVSDFSELMVSMRAWESTVLYLLCTHRYRYLDSLLRPTIPAEHGHVGFPTPLADRVCTA